MRTQRGTFYIMRVSALFVHCCVIAAEHLLHHITLTVMCRKMKRFSVVGLKGSQTEGKIQKKVNVETLAQRSNRLKYFKLKYSFAYSKKKGRIGTLQPN